MKGEYLMAAVRAKKKIDSTESNRIPALSFCLRVVCGQMLRVCPKRKPVSTPGEKPEGMLFRIMR
jgi:hypothetical protein